MEVRLHVHHHELNQAVNQSRYFPLKRLGLAPGRRNGAYDPVSRYPARQGADVAILEGALGTQGYFDRLLDVGCRTRRLFKGYVNDPEPDLRLD